jgi:la-related protein 1
MSDWDVIGPVSADPVNKDDEGFGAFYSDRSGSMAESSSVDSTSGEFLRAQITEPSSLNPRETAAQRSRRRRSRGSGDDPFQHSIDTTAHNIMRNGFDPALYGPFRAAALQQRQVSEAGQSPAMTSLYHFWCLYLRQSFDQAMYEEFLRLAREDARRGWRYGMECYFRFCSYGLEQRFDPQIWMDFQTEALADLESGVLYGLEKVCAFLYYQKLESEPMLIPAIEEALRPFPTPAAFKTGGAPQQQQQQQKKKHKGGSGKRGRGGRGRAAQEEPRVWLQGKAQPASAPLTSPMRRGYNPQ